jgi:hypothetical protein
VTDADLQSTRSHVQYEGKDKGLDGDSGKLDVDGGPSFIM